ncbi:MAG: EAL domain-containing protein [Rhodoferax sp.]|uniref:putative bifunctional diguanylate cyclase/phosphodiesterase n=1 Tax=Rhodoferax sp. TaxID=50421 RepID=UPI003267DEA5
MVSLPTFDYKVWVHPPNQESKHSLRMRRALLVWSAVMALGMLCWAVYFGWHGTWSIAVCNILLAAIAAMSAVLTRRGRTRSATLLMAGSLYVGLCLLCLVQDIPNAQAPRSAHHFFLVMGMGTFLIFKGERAWLRHGISVLCFATFFVFASTQWGFDTPYVLPDAVRIPGTWFNNTLALLVLYALLHVMQSEMTAYKAMAAELRKGLSGNQFALYYQPQTDEQGRIAGAEALVRWMHPVNGMVSPAEFIPVAEQTGFILPLGHWVLGTACAQLVRWSQDPATAALTIAVNVSAQQFKQPDYVKQVLSVLARSGAVASRLKLELTEGMLVNDVDDIIAKMTALRAHGVRLSLDDFGTGYSSLSYLKKLPLDQLKIDKSFVRDVLTDPNDAAIARTVVTLAHSMGLQIIAEGVETEGQRAFLAEIGCSAIQGYLLSRPVPIAEFGAFLEAYNART